MHHVCQPGLFYLSGVYRPERSRGSGGPYVKRLYENTPVGNGTRWLMIDVTSESIEKTVEELLLVRIKPPENKTK